MTENLEARPAQLKKLCHVSVRGRKSGLSSQRAVYRASHGKRNALALGGGGWEWGEGAGSRVEMKLAFLQR